MGERNRISLDGTWDFLFDPQDHRDPADIVGMNGWRQAVVPMPWQAQFDDLHDASGTGWYRRTFSVDGPVSGSAVLHFGAVDYFTTVWLNGQKVGEHEGGYLPFEFDVTRLLKPGNNELIVRALDPGEDQSRWPEFPFTEVPHGKQSWYMPVGGIWQSVWLELRPAQHLSALRLTPDPKSGKIEVLASLNPLAAVNQPSAVDEPVPAQASVQVRVLDPDGKEVAQGTGTAAQPITVQVNASSVRLWSPESPFLYTVQASLVVDGSAVDSLSAVCGFRTVEIRDKRILLNGQPVYLRGALDQSYFPETVYTVPSVAYLEDQARKAKELGLNCLRTHIKVEDPRYYEVADRMGLLIWTEIPNWVYLSPEASRRAKETFQGMVERDWNHPSIICWSLVNENWGTDLLNNPEHRAWLDQFYREAKAIDPYRLVVDNSVCPGNLHVAGDLDDVHDYRAIPDHAKVWDEVMENFSHRLEWSWSKDYLANRREDLPLIVSEFGNWGLPDPRRLQEKGGEPWWFETGYNHGEGQVYPHGMINRYNESELRTVYSSFDAFIKNSQEHMARSLAYEISTMRLLPDIGGYIITEFTDVNWECNGLMTMQREIKQGLEKYFTPLDQDRVVVLRPQRWSGKPGESLPVEMRCMGVDGPESSGTIRWRAGKAQGQLSAPGGIVEIPLPEGSQSALVSIEAQWVDASGKSLASDIVEVACVMPGKMSATLYVENDEPLAAALRALGYQVADQAEPGALIVARYFTEYLRKKLQDGENVLVLADETSLQQPDSVGMPYLRIIPREGTSWQGDWATSFSWIKKQGPFASLPGDPILEMEYADVMPDSVLAGLPAWAAPGNSWAGLALGWIHRIVSLLTTMPYGKARLTATTFKLTPELITQNAVAQALVAGVVELASAK